MRQLAPEGVIATNPSAIIAVEGSGPPETLNVLKEAKIPFQTVSEKFDREAPTLPEAQREAVTMAYFGGCSYRQVAERLGIPEGTAKSRMRMALARLAQLLQSESPLA